jgi:hypothetical protein
LQSQLGEHGFQTQMEQKRKREKRALIPEGSPFSNDPDDESKHYPKCIRHERSLQIGVSRKEGKNKGRPYFYCKQRFDDKDETGSECTWKWMDTMIAKDDPKKLKYTEQMTPIAYATMLKYWNQVKREEAKKNDNAKDNDTKGSSSKNDYDDSEDEE